MCLSSMRAGWSMMYDAHRTLVVTHEYLSQMLHTVTTSSESYKGHTGQVAIQVMSREIESLLLTSGTRTTAVGGDHK